MQRTIAVEVTGEQQVKEMQKLIDKLQKSVLDVEAHIAKGRGGKPLSFKVGVEIDKGDITNAITLIKEKFDKQSFKLHFEKDAKNINSVKKSVKEQLNLYPIKLKFDFNKTALNSTVASIKKHINDGDDLKLKMSPKLAFTKAMAKDYVSDVKSIMDDAELKAKVGINQTYFRKELEAIKTILNGADLSLNLNIDKARKRKAYSNLPKEDLDGYKVSNHPLPTYNISKIDLLRAKIKEISLLMLKASLINPFKAGIAGSITFTKQLTGVVARLNNTVGGFARNGLSNLFHNVYGQLRNIMGSVVEETKQIGDALAVYTLNMRQLGISDSVANKDLKTLTEYGKKSVYDASELIRQATTYRAYEREDSVDLVKALAGLSAQTEDPIKSMEGIGKQLSDVLARQKVTWQDIKFMKGWFNALGANTVNKKLDEIAQAKGYESAIKAIEKKAISVEELLGVLKEVGLSEGMQALVTTIATPSQALANLKENLANQFVIPEFNEDGTRGTAPLQNLYDATRDFLLELSGIVGGSNFTSFVKALGDDIGGVINRSVQLSKYVRSYLSPQVINSAKKFHEGFKEGLNSVEGFTQKVTELVGAFSSFDKTDGANVGKNLAQITKSVIEFTTEVIKAGKELTSGGILDGFSSLVSMYTGLLKLANKSGALNKGASLFAKAYDTFDRIVSKGSTLKGVKSLVTTLGNAIDNIITIIDKIANGKGNAVYGALGVLNALYKGIESFTASLNKNLKVSSVNGAFGNIINAVEILTTGIGNVLGIIVAKAVDILATEQAMRILQNIGTFVSNVATIIGNMVISAHNLGVLDVILNFLTVLTQFLADVSTLLTNPVFGTLAIAAVAYFSGLIGFLKTIWNSTNALETLLGTSFAKGIGTKISNSVRSKIPFMANYADEAALGIGGIVGGVKGATKGGLASAGFSASGKPLFKPMQDVAKNTGKLSNIMSKLTGSALFGKVATKFAPVSNFAKSATKFVTSGKANLIALGGQLASNLIDGFVQGSNAPDVVKKGVGVFNSLVNVGASTFGGASLGSLAGPWGTIAGGVYGFYSSVKNELTKQNDVIDKELAEANAQIEQETDLLVQEISSVAKQRGDIVRQMNSQFAQMLVFESTELDKGELGSTIGLIQQAKANLGTTLTSTMDTLGVNIRDIPININELFVRINGELVQFSKLQEETGLSSEELYGAMKLLQGTLGAPFVEFFNANGQFVTSVNTFTEEQRTHNEEKVKELQTALSQFGVSLDKLGDLSVGKANQIKNDLEYALNGSNFRTVAEQDQAIRDALIALDSDMKDKVGEFSGKKLKQHAQGVLDSVISATLTPQEEQAGKYEEYKEVLNTIGKSLGLTKTQINKKIKAMASATVEELQKELDNYKGADIDTSNGTLGEQKIKLESIRQSVTHLTDTVAQQAMDNASKQIESLQNYGLTTNYGASASYVSKVLEQAGIVDEGIRNFILQQISDNGLSVKEAIALAKEKYEAPSTVDLDKTISDFIDSVNATVGEGGKKVDEARKVLEAQGIFIQEIDSNKLSVSGKELKQKVEESLKASETKQKEASGKVDVETQNTKNLSTSGVATSATNLKNSTNGSVKGAESKLNEASSKAKADYSGIDTSGIDAAKNNLWNKVKSFIDDTATWLNNAFNYSPDKQVNIANNNKPKGGGKKKKSKNPWEGGLITPTYRNIGGLIDWKKRATDTVPAMLTKGEYVLRKKAVEELGVNFLNKLNTRGSDALHSFAKPSTTVYNVYNNNNAQITQNVNNKSGYLNGLSEIDRFMRYV